MPDLVTCLPELVVLGSKTVACGANSHTKIFIAKNIDMSPEQELQGLGDALRCHCTEFVHDVNGGTGRGYLA